MIKTLILLAVVLLATVALSSPGCESAKSISATDSLPPHHVLHDDAYMQAHAHDTIDMSDSALDARFIKGGLGTLPK